MTLPSLLIIFIGLVFLIWEHLHPGRTLPNTKGWYIRSIMINLCQLGVVILAGVTWQRWFHTSSLFHFESTLSSPFEGLLYWFIGTFIFYWWHRLRHENGWWQIFHQIHHSPARIEALTAFYKHPIEMITNSILISTVIFMVFGGSIEAAAWYNVYAVFGELFYHSNIRTPHWIGYFIQRPEHHSIHHQTHIHRYNFADITLWDRLFGTFKDTDTFTPHCGFATDQEKHLDRMLVFKNGEKDQTS